MSVIVLWPVPGDPLISGSTDQRIRLAGGSTNQDPVFFTLQNFAQTTTQILVVFRLSEGKATCLGICRLPVLA